MTRSLQHEHASVQEPALRTYSEHKRRQRGEQGGVDHGQQAGEVTLPGSDKEQPAEGRTVTDTERQTFCLVVQRPPVSSVLPGRREQGAVDRAEAGQTHKHGDDPRHHTEVLVAKFLGATSKGHRGQVCTSRVARKRPSVTRQLRLREQQNRTELKIHCSRLVGLLSLPQYTCS